MKIFETLAHCGGVLLMATLVLLASLNPANAVWKNTAIFSTFNMIQTTNNLSHTNVNRTYENTGSVLHCGMRCSNIISPSFYYVDQTSTCHCNNHHDPAIEEYTGAGSITYGFIEVEDQGPRPGNSSECQALLFHQGIRDDGFYNGSTGDLVFCNLTAFGWIVFQRRLDGSIDFYRNWTEYVNGFGDPNGEFWLGLETIHQLTSGGGCELNIYLEAEPNVTVQDNGYARYSSFSLASATDNYRLYVSGFSGNVGDSFMSRHNGDMFSTYDVDNDISGANCAEAHVGAWWYDTCHDSNLNGIYLAGSHTAFADGVNWKVPWGYYYSLLRTEMAVRC